jgi:hypothetical protein
MRHRMTVDNSHSGHRYHVVVEGEEGAWQASWNTTTCDGGQVDGLHGAVAGATAEDVFHRAKRAIEDEDLGVMDVDWQFEEPLPPWLLE